MAYRILMVDDEPALQMHGAGNPDPGRAMSRRLAGSCAQARRAGPGPSRRGAAGRDAPRTGTAFLCWDSCGRWGRAGAVSLRPG